MKSLLAYNFNLSLGDLTAILQINFFKGRKDLNNLFIFYLSVGLMPLGDSKKINNFLKNK